MADYNQELSDLHQRVVQSELQLPATIDDVGYVNFEHPELGGLYISLQRAIPEFMQLACIMYRDDTHALADILAICNRVNLKEFPVKITIDDSCYVVSAQVELLLAEHGRMPNEGLLRAVIHQAIASIKKGIELFAIEIEKLDNDPPVIENEFVS